MKTIKKIIMISIIVIMFINISMVNASFKINKADLYSKGTCQSLLIDTSINAPIIVEKVFYTDGVGEYPAYCLNRELSGVGTLPGYSVTVEEAVSNILVWRVITNGYPYKSFTELGVVNEDEAYTATKQAVYCVLYNNDADNYKKYSPIGDEGDRTLNAMKKIVSNARNSVETKPSSNIQINEKNSLWDIDSLDSNYISKEFSVSAEATIKSYDITISGDILDGTKIVNINNEEKNIFSPNENFKILIPVRSLEKSGNISISVNGEVATKPILYGNSNDSTTQDYALVADFYELGNGSFDLKYNKNTSKLIIKKQELETENKLTGAEFNILDSNMNIIYEGIKVNEEGIAIIEGILPGNYFIEETKAPDGYGKYEGKIDFTVKLNEEVTLIINNSKETTIEKETSVKSVKAMQNSSQQITKLPKTGM